MWMLPSPKTCSLLAFYQFTIFTFGIDKCHIAMIFFRFFIQQFKNPLTRCDSG